MESKKKPSELERKAKRGLKNMQKAWLRKKVNKLPIPYLAKVFIRSFI